LGVLRIPFVLGPFVLLTLLLIPVQALAVRLNVRLSHTLPVAFHRLALKVLGIRVTVIGAPAAARPLLLTPNHASWLDIVILGSLLPLSFVAKAEVADWPLVGTLARLQRTVFVDRTRRSKTGEVAGAMASRLAGGDALVLFAEGTSNTGNRVLPFRSALFGAVQGAIGAGGEAYVQPMAVLYTRLHGIPLGRGEWTLFSWTGDQELLPHLLGVVRLAALDVRVVFGEPLPFPPGADRKAVAAEAEARVRAMIQDTVRQGF